MQQQTSRELQSKTCSSLYKKNNKWTVYSQDTGMFEQIKNKRNDCILNFILTLLGFTKQQRVLFRSLRWFELSTNWADEVFIMPELSGLIKQLMIWWQPSAARNYELLFNHLLANLTWSSVLCIYRQLWKSKRVSFNW